ncbi:hypothetical protein [Odoribacter splanchnicus]|uniref:hypothetical protein n=1 Tax=Odoribacter splanchnicus TaxID=28118 RepID=UPI0034BF1935
MESKELAELVAVLKNKLGEHERKIRKLRDWHLRCLTVFFVLFFSILIVWLYFKPLEMDICLRSMQIISLYYVIPSIIGIAVLVVIYLCKIKLLGYQEEIRADNVLKRKIEWENELNRMDTLKKEQDYSLELRRRVEGVHKNLFEELTNLLEENEKENRRLKKLLDLYAIDKKE